MNIFWLEQAEANIPPEDNWLTPDERFWVKGMRFPKRRRDYLLGRWTAKRALAAYLDWPIRSDAFADIDIRTAPSGAPIARISGNEAHVVISISHRSGVAMCAVAPSGIALGCDLELVESRSDAFVHDYFTAEEQEILYGVRESERPWLVTLFWSAKESALKALQQGLRLDTRSVVVRLPQVEEHLGNRRNWTSDIYPQVPDTLWNRFDVICRDGLRFQGWSQYTDNFVRTIVSTSACAQPMLVAPWAIGEISTGAVEQALLESTPLGAGP